MAVGRESREVTAVADGRTMPRSARYRLEAEFFPLWAIPPLPAYPAETAGISSLSPSVAAGFA